MENQINSHISILFCSSRPDLNPPLSCYEELKRMDREGLGYWGLGWWQAEAVKQAHKVSLLEAENARLREMLAKG
jgi:hypothetical protein